MPAPTPPQRRTSDPRLDNVERKLDNLSVRVNEIRDWLIGEPESSALGRQLLQRAKDNRADINVLRDRMDEFDDWRQEMRGSWRLVTSIATVLGVVATILAILSWVR